MHAATIAKFAFQTTVDPNLSSAQAAARDLVVLVFKTDGKDIIESVLGLATIAFTERRRLKRKRRALKYGQTFPPPVPVEKLHRVSIRGELWKAAYNEFNPADPIGLSLLISAVAPVTHIEILNREQGWNPDELKEVIKPEAWIASVRAINWALKTVQSGIGPALESLAAQPNPATLRTFWEQPRVAKPVITLLLSPAEEIHEPVLNLIQQSFDDVDDRGDCFRTLLERYPVPAMDGLCAFLSSFIQTGRVVPEACSLAKWLVRCFTDILDVLCQPSGTSPPLLQSESFLSSYGDGKWMTRRISDLWQLMTDSLALIFRRTADWAPYFENDVMVDWMRDALIFARMITDNIRVFESAVLSRSKAPQDDPAESPVRMSQVGKSLVQKLEVVLADLTGWLRLTDAETLHQAYELITTILGRISKTNVDLSKDKQLEDTLLELEKFSRRAGQAYNCRLSGDLLSELADLLETFDLPVGEDEIKFIKEVKGASPDIASDTESVAAKLRRAAISQSRSADQRSTPKATSSRNAFDVMMNKAGGKYVPSDKPRAPKPAKPRQMTLEEFENDNSLDNLSAADLDIIEQRAQSLSSARDQRSRVIKVPPKDSRDKLVLNFVPKPAPSKSSTSSSFTSKFMRDIANEHKAQLSSGRKKANEPAFAPRLPQASKIGTGLGAYTGPPQDAKPKPKPVETDSSDTDSSSDEESKGLGALLAPKKTVLAPPRENVVKRSIKPMGPTAADIIKERERKRREVHATKQRLRPDLTPLFRFVLQWDPTHTGPNPPHPPKVAEALGPLKPIPTTFSRVQDYEKIMLPTFLQELWAQFNKDAQSSPPLLAEVTTRAYEDDFLDIDIVIPAKLPPGVTMNDSDIVTIQAEGGQPIFAKVQGFRRKFKESALKMRILSSMDQRGMGAKSKVKIQKHVS